MLSAIGANWNKQGEGLDVTLLLQLPSPDEMIA